MKGVRIIPLNGFCEGCGVAILSKYNTVRKYCNPACRQKHYISTNADQKEKSRAYKKAWYHHRNKLYLAAVPCCVCGTPFIPKTNRSKICESKKCLNHFYNQRRVKRQAPAPIEKQRQYYKKWLINNKRYSRDYQRESRQQLQDRYVLRCLKQSTTHVTNPTPELIDLKRIHLTLKRIQNERKKELTINS